MLYEVITNQGTVFTVRLPVVVDKTEDEVDVEKVLALDKKHETQNLVFDTTDISKIKTDSELSSSRIFFAEDNADMRRFVSAAFVITSYSIHYTKLYDALYYAVF